MKNLIIDAFNMIHRSRFGQKGDHGTTYTFFRSLRSEVERHKPDRVFVVWEGRPVRRIAENAEYKANRAPVLDDGFHRQKRDIRELCKLLPVTSVVHPEHECDDVIAYIVRSMLPNDEHVVCSSDSDFIQLIDERVSLWNPIRKDFVQFQNNYVVWKALRGDKSDNIPGVRGIGDVTATKLANDEKLLQEFLANSDENRHDFESSYKQILFENVDSYGVQAQESNYDSSQLMEEFRIRGFSSIVEKSWVKWSLTWTNLEMKCKQL